MKRKLLFPALVLVAGLTWALAAAEGRAPVSALAGRRPNIILILTDDQGYGDMSCHGNPVLKTPNLDRLHAEGRRFLDFLVSPTCSPTRAAILTGRHEFKSGVTHTIYERERLAPGAVTLAELLRQAGYQTGIFGKWHLGDEREYWPDRRGFGEFFIHGAGGIGQTYPGSCGDAPDNSYFSPVILHNGRFVKTTGYCTDVFFTRAITWMDEARRHGPFFTMITPNAPHTPLDVPAEYEALYAGRVPTNVAKFFGMIANLDDNVGRLLARLQVWGLERDTLIIFMNDNGGTQGVSVFNAGMRGQKGTPWWGGVRAASFWRWPGVLPPGDIAPLAAHVDIMPTLLEIAGAKVPAAVARQWDGRSLAPLLLNPAAPWPDRFLVTHLGRWPTGKAAGAKYSQCSVRYGPYQLVSAGKTAGTWELYDLRADPGQTRNLAQQQPEVVEKMAAFYDRWWEEIQPCLVNEMAVGPKINPFKELYWRQFGGEPTAALLQQMNPQLKFAPASGR
ncbi:arylsulfatase [Fontisphaera persica]|uniref:arylsulfatase n=1 Tax=Fontisphaera persica TaxID=2974023 RepID=UPI0024C00FFE|nr:arylsulfatase [Fontisphaera persica]WCJ59467.1 arylsulfatase [Fontisphaera persica]